jgi:hypothetical protein
MMGSVKISVFTNKRVNQLPELLYCCLLFWITVSRFQIKVTFQGKLFDADNIIMSFLHGSFLDIKYQTCWLANLLISEECW